MADLDELIDQAAQPSPRPCKYARILNGLTDVQRDRLDQFDSATIARILTEAGHPVSDNTVGLHRRGHPCG